MSARSARYRRPVVDRLHLLPPDHRGLPGRRRLLHGREGEFGTVFGLLAAAALLLDYILVVAVGISAGVGALVSAVPCSSPTRSSFAWAFWCSSRW